MRITAAACGTAAEGTANANDINAIIKVSFLPEYE
jgi:hypothetical protein